MVFRGERLSRAEAPSRNPCPFRCRGAQAKTKDTDLTAVLISRKRWIREVLDSRTSAFSGEVAECGQGGGLLRLPRISGDEPRLRIRNPGVVAPPVPPRTGAFAVDTTVGEG